MTTLTTLRAALRKVEGSLPRLTESERTNAAAALRTLIAAMEKQEPVAWFITDHGGLLDFEWGSNKPKHMGDWRPLYTREQLLTDASEGDPHGI